MLCFGTRGCLACVVFQIYFNFSFDIIAWMQDLYCSLDMSHDVFPWELVYLCY